MTDEKGATVKWGVEGMSPNYLARRGWTKNTFKPGDMPAEIVAAGWQMDVKNYWPDRSVKLAFLSKIVTAAGTSTTPGNWRARL